jgi:hypothetical protein
MIMGLFITYTEGVFPFIAAGMTALFISLITVCCHTLKASAADPADTLRYE